MKRKEEMKENVLVLERKFSRTKYIWKIYNELIKPNDSYFSQSFKKDKTFKKYKMRSLECLYLLFIDLKHSQSNVYSILLITYDTPTTKRV